MARVITNRPKGDYWDRIIMDDPASKVLDAEEAQELAQKWFWSSIQEGQHGTVVHTVDPRKRLGTLGPVVCAECGGFQVACSRGCGVP